MIPAKALRAFAQALLEAAGMPADKAAATAEVLAEADLLGHDTHGVALLPRYLEEIASGAMILEGAPRVVKDTGACITWDGRRLPGCWLALTALDLAMERAATHGIAAVAIGDAHHIGGLAAYLRRATERGMVLSILSSAPGAKAVAPFGGLAPTLSPAPFAFGAPTAGDPVMVDVSASITTINMALRMQREGRRYAHPWLMDAQGNASDDPAVLASGGSALPAGGLDHGQKGYGWALHAEAMSQGLSGHGRADAPKGMVNAVFLQVTDPAAFAGLDAFTRQAQAIADACRASPPRPGVAAVRLPGEAGLRRREQALRDGVALRAEALAALRPHAERLGVRMVGQG